MGIRTKFRWLASGGAATAFLPFVYDWFSAKLLAEDQPVVGWFQSIFGADQFYWFVFGVCGLAVGAWLDVIFEKVDREKYFSIVNEMNSFLARFDARHPENNDQMMHDLTSLAGIERMMKKRKLPTYDCKNSPNRITLIHKSVFVMRQIKPFLENGDRKSVVEIITEYNDLEVQSQGNENMYKSGSEIEA